MAFAPATKRKHDEHTTNHFLLVKLAHNMIVEETIARLASFGFDWITPLSYDDPSISLVPTIEASESTAVESGIVPKLECSTHTLVSNLASESSTLLNYHQFIGLPCTSTSSEVVSSMNLLSEEAIKQEVDLPSTSASSGHTSGASSPEAVPSTSMAKHPRSSTSHECNLCGYVVRSNLLLKRLEHIREHASRKRFSCKLCPYETEEVPEVIAHMRDAHKRYGTCYQDQLSKGLKEEWDSLMHQCFPFVYGTTKGFKKRGRPSKDLVPIDAVTADVLLPAAKTNKCKMCKSRVEETEVVAHVLEKHKFCTELYVCDVCHHLADSKESMVDHYRSGHLMIREPRVLSDEVLSALILPLFYS